jgi:hypothetical protein
MPGGPADEATHGAPPTGAEGAPEAPRRQRDTFLTSLPFGPADWEACDSSEEDELEGTGVYRFCQDYSPR